MKIVPTEIVSIDLKGNLLFSIAPDYQRQFMITSWNSGMHFYLKTEEGWQQEMIDTGLMLVSYENIALENEPVSQYLKQLPNELIELVQPYRYRQFSMLQLIAQQPYLLDLIKHSANLFWMFVVEAENHSWSQVGQATILQQKRAFILKQLGGGGSKKSVRFINKIELYKGTQSEYELINKCLNSNVIIDSFKHWQTIPIQALAVILRFPYFLNTRIVASEVNTTKTLAFHRQKFFRLQEIVYDIERMARQMERELPPRYKENISSEMALNCLHVNWIVRFNRANAQLFEADPQAVENREWVEKNPLARKRIAFPICPLGDLTDVIQIKSNHDLIKEGMEMSHCVGSYVENARQEKSYFYKLLSPERATLQVKVAADKVSVVQFKLAHNKKPSVASYQYLQEVFDKRVSEINS